MEADLQSFARRVAALYAQPPAHNWYPDLRDMMDRVYTELPRALEDAYGSRVRPSDMSDPYANWTDLSAAAQRARLGIGWFRVSQVATDHPILSHVDVYSWRSHHDSVHVTQDHQGAFGFWQEIRCFLDTPTRYGSWDRSAVRGLFADLVGQAAWFDVHGSFPTDLEGDQKLPGGSAAEWDALIAEAEIFRPRHEEE